MTEATEFFDASWSIYERVLDHNYMFHQKLYQEVQHLLTRGKLFQKYGLGINSNTKQTIGFLSKIFAIMKTRLSV